MKDDLIEDVAKLFTNRGGVLGFDCINQLIGLLEQVLNERLVGLLGVPRAATRAASVCAVAMSLSRLVIWFLLGKNLGKQDPSPLNHFLVAQGLPR